MSDFTVLQAENKGCLGFCFGRAIDTRRWESNWGPDMQGASALISVFAVLLLVNVFAFVRRL